MSKIQFNIGIIVLLILQLTFIDNYHDWGDDFALYLHQAKALITGDIHCLRVDNTLMMNKGKVGPYLYPNGFPLLLSIIHLFSVKLYFFKLIGVLSFIVSVMVLNKISALFIDDKIARLMSLIVAIQPFLFFQSDDIGSDLPALATSLSATYFFFSIDWKNQSHVKMILFSFLTIFTITIRTNYLFLAFGFFILSLIKLYFGKSINIKMAFFSFLPIFIYFILSKLFLISDGQNELISLKKVLISPVKMGETFFTNLHYYIKMLSYELVYSYTSRILFIIVIFYLFLIKLKSLYNFKKICINNKYKLAFLNIIVFSIYLLWPYQQGTRFVLYNMVFVPMGIGLFLTKYSKVTLNKSFLLAFLTLSVYSFCIQYLNSKTKSKNEYIGSNSFNQAISAIKKHTFPSSIILSNKPRVIHYYTKRRSVLITANNFNHMRPGDLILVRHGIDSASLYRNIPNSKVILTSIFKNECCTIYKKLK